MIHRIPKLKYNRKTKRQELSCNKSFQMKEDDAKCFKMHPKSEAASKLKSAISNKLRHFLPNYSDDVLAEYITVLVCNEKDQYQARDDLDAFLGETTAEFVSWLWDYLLEYSFETNEYLGFSHPKPPTASLLLIETD